MHGPEEEHGVVTVKLFPVTSEHAEATWQKGRGLCLPLVRVRG